MTAMLVVIESDNSHTFETTQTAQTAQAEEIVIMNSNISAGSRIFRALSTATLLAASILITATARADDDQVRVETVQFQDLNVNTLAGAQALYDRIYAAANRVCEWTSSGDPFAAIRAGKCARKAAAKAVEQLNLPALTAYYNVRTGAKAPTLIAKR